MRPLVIGNSHIVGFKRAAELDGQQWATVPTPLCPNFEQVIRERQGVFELDPWWRNMRQASHEERKSIVRYPLETAAEDGMLVIVGEKLFGCFPIFGALLAAKKGGAFPIWPGPHVFNVPYDDQYILVSRSCLKEALVAQIRAAAESFHWLISSFKMTFWIPSPPPPQAFVSAKLPEHHHWYANSELHRHYLDLFNECLIEVNSQAEIKKLGLTFLGHPKKHIQSSGFLTEQCEYAPKIPEDIHANEIYYAEYIPQIASHI